MQTHQCSNGPKPEGNESLYHFYFFLVWWCSINIYTWEAFAWWASWHGGLPDFNPMFGGGIQESSQHSKLPTNNQACFGFHPRVHTCSSSSKRAWSPSKIQHGFLSSRVRSILAFLQVRLRAYRTLHSSLLPQRSNSAMSFIISASNMAS